MPIHAERVGQRQSHLPAGGVRGGGGPAERTLRLRRVEQVALQVGHRRIRHQRLVHVRLAERHGGSKERIHGALAFGRDQDQAARGRRTVRQRRRWKMHANRADVVAEHASQLVVRHFAEIRHARAQCRRDRAGVGGRTAAAFLAGRHRGIDRLCSLRVDQRHQPLAHVVAREERVVGARHHIDDSVADAEDVEPCAHQCVFLGSLSPPPLGAKGLGRWGKRRWSPTSP